MASQPGKLFYKIGEVSKLAQVEPYILRYWESEFPALSPKKSGGNQRVYQQKDLDLVLAIKRMLHEEGYTIAGARKKISEGGWRGKAAGAGEDKKQEKGREIVGAVPSEARVGPSEIKEKPVTETLELGIVAEERPKPIPSPAPRKIRKSPQMSLPFFEEKDGSGIQDALVKFKAEIKELIELVK